MLSAFSSGAWPSPAAAILNFWWKIEQQAMREKGGGEGGADRETERVRVRGVEGVSPVYFIHWQQSTIHNQGRLIHSFN